MKITLIKSKEHKNGDVTFTFDVDKEFQGIIKKKYNKKRFTYKLGKLFIIEASYEAVAKELDKELMRVKKLNRLK